ncbi:hypothetical protein CHS0354_017151 [Potamilus streckersoni]|uniref:Heat shock 70 kDa protein 12B n=1 Tax=Potamilus streckersoni TaxID=2493646 RepID=A0AAE0T2T4_9BIVA|nr:hypothetical protein CHS0354_017151 [Potamilus streckersoni]
MTAKAERSFVHDKLLVAAIDFGTTCTGYAYSLTQDYKKDPLNIGTKQSWPGCSDAGLQAPTSVLFTPEKAFHSFGFEAETKYKDLAFDNNQRDWYYFKHFKMILHRMKDLTRETNLEAANGKPMKARDVFAAAIKAVTRHVFEKIQTEHGLEITMLDILWVLTVPEICLCYLKAGIEGNNLSLALEPEVAAVYCKEHAIRKELRDGAAVLRSFDPGERYMVLDLGGGTVDVNIHEVCPDGKLKELYAASGGPWGGILVSEAFRNSIEDALGKDLFLQCLQDDSHGWILFENAFEDEKKSFIQAKLIHTRCTFQIVSRLQKHLTWQKNSTTNTMEEYFDVAIDKIKEHIRSLLEKKELGAIATIMLVGGFAESRVVQEKIKRYFKTKIVFVPPESGVSVLKGSVMFGHNPTIITERISPWTFGVHTRKAFNKRIHDSKRKKIVNGKEYMNNAFVKYIEIGESVMIGSSCISHTYTVINPKDSRVFWKVYKSSEKSPVYCDQKGVEFCGTLEVRLPEAAKDKKWRLELNMTCKGTELVASVSDAETKMQFKNIRLDFLVSECGSGSDFLLEAPQ